MKKGTISKLTFTLFAAAALGAIGCKTSTQYSRSTGEWWDDKTITHNVHKALNKDALTEKADIDVKSFRGDVVMTGFVDHPLQKQQATEVAKSVQGVQWVRNDIAVKGATPHAQLMGTTIREPAGSENMQWEKGQYNTSGKKHSATYSTESGKSYSTNPGTSSTQENPQRSTPAPEQK